jgi:hypothetical protein
MAIPLAVVVGVILGTVTAAGTFLAVGLPCANPFGGGPGTPLPLAYDARSVEVPVNTSDGSAGGPLTNVTFEAVDFQLWPLLQFNWSRGGIYGLDVVAGEPDGVNPNLEIFSPWATTEFPGLGFDNWTSPDRIASVSWVSNSTGSIDAVLRVADPIPDYLTDGVSVTPLHSTTYCFDNARFELSIHGYGGPGGDGLDANVALANGTTYGLGVFSGPPSLVCDVQFPGSLPSSTCLEDVSTDRVVGLVWNGDDNATLLVAAPLPVPAG